MGKTTIEWTGHTVNPVRARLKGTTGRSGHYCEKVGPDCLNCYSSRLQPRFGMPLFQDQRRGDIEIFLDAGKLREVLDRKTPTTWFWEDMSDLFGRWVSNEWIAACFGVMAATPQHTHQVLTKRAERLPEWFAWVETDPDGDPLLTCAVEASMVLYPDDVFKRNEVTDLIGSGSGAVPWPLPNVHLGVSAGNQQVFDADPALDARAGGGALGLAGTAARADRSRRQGDRPGVRLP